MAGCVSDTDCIPSPCIPGSHSDQACQGRIQASDVNTGLKDKPGLGKMACDEQRVKFAAIFENNIYFEVASKDYESDAFSKTNKRFRRMIQNTEKQFLVVNGEHLRFEERNVKQCRQEDCHFYFCSYCDFGSSDRAPVMVMVSDKGKDKIICCYNDGEGKGVHAKLQEQVLPEHIKESHHEALFFLRRVREGTNCFRMSSSLWPEYFLSFKAESDGLVKLVLREAGEDGSDGWEDGNDRLDGLQLLDA
ncbi:hypothetical protein GJAV_G00056680 [Gymnothorax javanicus]|nr:hypothetical protein GJAV_G00056680 [Gymnothorax javanicus]